MPNKVKLLSNVSGSVTGTGIKTNMMGLPFTIRIVSNAATGVGAGVFIESSEDSTTGLDGAWQTDIGAIGGASASTEQLLNATNLVTVADLSSPAPATFALAVKIDHPTKWLRAKSVATPANTTVTLSGRR